MKRKPLPSQEYLRKRFNYNTETGILEWREKESAPCISDGECRRWNTRYAGKVSGTEQNDQKGGIYWRSSLDGVFYATHRLIWRWMTGDDPVEIDHKDVDGKNNRWDNLRLSNRSQNNANRNVQRSNRDGKGVYFRRDCARYVAAISFYNKRIYLGRFVKAEDAQAAYREAARFLHGNFANYGSSDAAADWRDLNGGTP